MAPILNNQHVNLNGGDVNGINGGPTSVSSKVTAAVSGGNTQYQGLMKITSGGKGMSGGGRSRRHRRSHSSRRGSKKYARKRSLRHRLKHRKSGRRGHGHGRGHTKRRGQRGGNAQYLTNSAFTLGQRLPGFPLLPNQSALANPPPFMPYRNCGSGK
jgi:hypothetical protein